MLALQESLVEWTVALLGVAVVAALLLRWHGPASRRSSRTQMRPRIEPDHWLYGVALLAIVAHAGIASSASAASAAAEKSLGADALRLGAIAASAVLLGLLVAWLLLNPGLRILPSAPPDDDACCHDCPECTDAVATVPESTGRKRARGLTMTRLGGR